MRLGGDGAAPLGDAGAVVYATGWSIRVSGVRLSRPVPPGYGSEKGIRKRRRARNKARIIFFVGRTTNRFADALIIRIGYGKARRTVSETGVERQRWPDSDSGNGRIRCY